MPSVPFVLPHAAYWLGLILFPALCMWAVHRARESRVTGGPMLSVAYMFWLCAGFTGLHRFYVRSALGWLYLPLFAAVLFCNGEVKSARQATSIVRQDLRAATTEVERAEAQLRRNVRGAEGRRDAGKLRQDAARTKMDAAVALQERWQLYGAILGALIAAGLVVDGLLLPQLVRRQTERERQNPLRRFQPVEPPPAALLPGATLDPTRDVQTRASRSLDWITDKSGELVAYWTLLAIFVYYYEVVVRFVFNSPTNWAHESMFLMFGMQYLIAGAYGYKVDAHVRVDVLYVKLSARGRALVDLLTSVFFFIFVGTMLATGWIYMSDAMRLREVSFTEWGIQYWPVKIAIPLGAVLLLLQGLSKLAKDIHVLRATTA